MANALYPKYKQSLLTALLNVDIVVGTAKAVLIDTGVYTYSAAHQFYSDLSGVVGTATAIGTRTATNGLFDGDDVTFTSVSGASVEAIVIFIDTGVTTTSRLVAYIDTSVTGLPVTPNGGNIIVSWDAAGIFQL